MNDQRPNLNGAWHTFVIDYCRATARLLCCPTRTRAWELNWHLDQLLIQLGD